MAKLMTRIFGLLFVVAFFFCFTACDLSALRWMPSGGGSSTPSGGSSGGSGGGGGGHYSDETGTDYMFEQDENGNYVFFSDALNDVMGAQLMSIPKKDALSENEQTNTERRRFYDNLNSQFFVLSTYALTYLLGQFGGGFAGGEIQNAASEFVDDYVLSVSQLTPFVQNEDIFDTNEFLIEQNLTGWNYSTGNELTPVFADSPTWILHLSQLKIRQNYFDDYIAAYEPFVRLKLIEFVSNKVYGTENETSFDEILSPEQCEEMIGSRLDVFKSLGFEFGEFVDTDSVAAEFKAFLLDEVIGNNAISYGLESKTFAEPYYNYTEIEGEGEEAHEVEKMAYYDINGNGQFDASFTVTDEMFYVDYESFVDELLQNMKSFADEFVKIDAMEVQTVDAQRFFTPGKPAEEGSKKTLTNMDYAQYQSCVLFPKRNIDFDTLFIFVDSEIDFSLKIWVKFSFGGQSFATPVCLLNLDSTKPYDLTSDYDDESEWYDEDYDYDIDSDIDEEEAKEKSKQEAEEELFSEAKRNCALIPLEYVLTDEQFNLLKNGVRTYEGTLNYSDRGYHTNSRDNLLLKDDYSFQTVGDSQLLSFSGSGNYIEILFEIVNPSAEQNYNFKFLAMTGLMWEEESDDEQNTSLNSFKTKQESLDYDRKTLKNC